LFAEHTLFGKHYMTILKTLVIISTKKNKKKNKKKKKKWCELVKRQVNKNKVLTLYF